jgi:hypothetical protein
VNGIKTPAGSDHEALMDDLWCPDNGSGLSGVAVVKGLAAGTYTIYAYASAPDSTTYFTDVTTNGVGPQNVGGEWPDPFAFAEPITHTKFDGVVIAAGAELSIEFIWNIAPYASFNGFQVVPAGEQCLGDINGDGRVCQEDLGQLLAAFGTCEGQPGYDPKANISPSPVPACGNGQGIDQSDLGVLLSEYGTCGDPCP